MHAMLPRHENAPARLRRKPVATAFAALVFGTVVTVVVASAALEPAHAVDNVSPWDEAALDMWEVLGLNDTSELVFDVPVWAFAEIGDRVYIGGRFQQVRRGPGYPSIDQPFLAAFVDNELQHPFTRGAGHGLSGGG